MSDKKRAMVPAILYPKYLIDLDVTLEEAC
jgi:hypothetical protein